MEIVGTVISVDKNLATISVRRTSACGENCANCKSVCQGTEVQTTAENKAGARAGDVVKVESNSKDVLRAAVILYILPVLAAIVAAVISYANEMSDIFVVLLSAISFFASFIFLKCFEKNLTPKSYITKIIKVVE